MALALGANNAHAVGVGAGVHIDNTATVDYTVGSVTSTTTSNTTTVVVAEILNVAVLAPAAQTPVAPGTTGQVLRFRVDNLGNGPEAFLLVANNAVTGDNFDPIAASPAIYLDTGGGVTTAGVFDATDVPYVPGSNDPNLAGDSTPASFVYVYLVNNIPGSVSDNNIGRSTLTASARTGTGAAGTVFAGQGLLGTDAVVGTTTASALAQGEYLVQGIAVTATKSQVVVDQFGGAHPLPGARINYSIVVNAVGSGTATTSVFADNIPAGTTYLPGTLTLNSAALTDTADADAGAYETTPQPRVRVQLGNLTQASGTQTIQFAVRIN
ncbi:MAG TPA: hypothetical protein VGO61_07890 [Steroidobacteraceae bacterium]|jgi:uncharacterized repeat protein (TIGR01451 family)|nr:hypothetical protein [Steroidobacteraceae bacterium]